MAKPTLTEYLNFLKKNPSLCAHGMADYVQKNYLANRKSLEASYDAFLICCDWFAQQNPNYQADFFSRSSLELKHAIESHCGQFIPHGSVLAAAIFLGIHLNADFSQEQHSRAAANDGK